MTWLEFQLKIISFIDVDYSPTEIEKKNHELDMHKKQGDQKQTK